MEKQHQYKATILWTGNQGQGTTGYQTYSREHTISIENKMNIPGSSDADFRGDSTRYNPEELLLCSLSACHMLWYLHLCAEAGVVVTAYEDQATGIMTLNAEGSGQFAKVILYPKVVVADSTMINRASSLHQLANEMCFIARSVNFPVKHEVEMLSLKQ